MTPEERSDGRVARTRAQLREAVLELAAERQIESIGAAEIARTAHVTRGTFYNHADSPADLLTAVLGTDLDRLIDELPTEVPDHGAAKFEVFQYGVRALAAHLTTHLAVYRTGFGSARPSPTLVTLLSERYARWLRPFVAGEVDPDSTPARLRAAFGDTVLDLYVMHAAYGGVGMLVQWLRDDGIDFEEVVQVGLTVLPPFWFGGFSDGSVPTRPSKTTS
ncbi:TetR/AcrR family transcriptional regulator [Streptomyces sp. E5N91]|uniref:TetR/AcrR family transcriptional regulator n=1 Tax=Streptomyces sp. E5N91 TaxID=1851996 RepID=UPI000EF5AA5C|nr:TetR/AcrR family transcriptional regulator [Streptomyces sp. E5N91]